MKIIKYIGIALITIIVMPFLLIAGCDVMTFQEYQGDIQSLITTASEEDQSTPDNIVAFIYASRQGN